MLFTKPMAVLFAMLLCFSGFAQQKPNSSEASTNRKLAEAKQRIRKVLFHDNFLWVLGQNGTLLKVDVQTKRVEIASPEKVVLDIYRSYAKHLYALTESSLESSRLRVWREADDSWQQLTPIVQPSASAVMGLAEYHEHLVVLTTLNIFIQGADLSWRSVRIKRNRNSADQTPLAVTPFAVTENGYAYLGLNQGEWGGGLEELNLETGLVKKREKRATTDLCAGPLNSECDPVTGVIVDQQQPECVIASIGLRHFLEKGRLIQVCKDSVSVVFSKAYREIGEKEAAPANPLADAERMARASTEAIFDLVKSGDGYWAVTGRGVYHFVPGQREAFYPMPKLIDVSGIGLSSEIPGVVIVSTDINWAHSVSGYTPLIAVRD